MNSGEALDLDAAADVLRALAHSVRLALLQSLIAGERSVGEIEQSTGVAQPGLSQQLGILRKANLVHTRKKAKLVFYRINQKRVEQVSGLLDGFAGTIAIASQDDTADRMRAGRGAAMFARIVPRT